MITIVTMEIYINKQVQHQPFMQFQKGNDKLQSEESIDQTVITLLLFI